jgi:quercetin dioxygenase-like cupin family protein
MTTTDPPQLTIVQPGGGSSGNLGFIGVDFKLWSDDTGGAVSIVEHPFPVVALVPPHLHTREDEYSIVTEGEIGFRSGDREAVLGAGGYITKPRNELHAMWNAGAVPARMIEVISPAGFENFFREVSELLLGVSEPDPGQIAEIAGSYGASVRTTRLASGRHLALQPDTSSVSVRLLSQDRTRCPRCPASRGTTRSHRRQATVVRVPRPEEPAVHTRPRVRPGARHPRALYRPARRDAADS